MNGSDAARSRNATPDAPTSDPAADLAATTAAWVDRHWDHDTSLLWNPPGAFGDLAPPHSLHLVPGSAWHAMTLLHRGASDDAERAVGAIESLLALQYDEPGTAIHGTFARFAEWPHPPADPVMWDDYDPNWRQFLGTTFGLLLRSRPGALPGDVEERVVRAMDLAVRGEPDGRVAPWYSNIALMKAWLEVDHGDRTGDTGLVERGEALAAEVVALFDRHGAFDEYNSATYYGIDLYALALWRDWSASPRLREWGGRIESALWRDLSGFYHAGLRNLAGPYTRSYTMDLTGSVGLLGLWIWAALGRADAPVPDLPGDPDVALDHSHDLALGTLVALLGPRIPDDAIADLTLFRGERRVEHDLGSGRIASAWLAPDVMVGAERGPADWGGWDQYHPATIHWTHPDGGVAWLRLLHGGGVDAVASPGVLEVTARPPASGRDGTALLGALGAGEARLGSGGRWSLPGLDVRVTSDGALGEPIYGSPGDAGPGGSGEVRLPIAPPGVGEPLRIRIEVDPRA
ncbi:MAG: hypothetical protein M5T61_13170 [Acidimicrobiia bacterium]|nr:hypothetical protein [Acidimicrobiia bacterium]